MADLLALVADALQVGDGLDGGDDHAQVAGRRCARGEDAAALLVDRHFHAVDLVIVLRHGSTEGAVALDQRGERRAELLLDEAAHGEHLAAHVLEILVEALRDVVGEISSFHGAASRERSCSRI